MDITLVKSLFTLFSGEEDVVTYLPLLSAAAAEVARELREDADTTQTRLCYLTAAVANLRYMQMFGAREKALATYAGTVRRADDAGPQIGFARQLVYAYRKLCADLLKDPDFVFSGIRG